MGLWSDGRPTESYPETGFAEINGDLREEVFQPEIVFG
jgi:hypothetical protein